MADASGKLVKVVVVTPEKAAFEGDAEFVVLPIATGAERYLDWIEASTRGE